MEKYFLGCDWGTSSFRLWLCDIIGQYITAEVTSEKGVAAMHREWQDLVATDNSVHKIDFFRKYLKQEIDQLSNKCSVNLNNVAIVISGMASSSIGMEEVAYSKLPFALDGSDISFKHIASNAAFLHDIILVSGVCSENDVMRGEETQLIGLLPLLEKAGTKLTQGVLIFPGTHSKHIRVENGTVIAFNTFMTGELFSLMSKQSILKDSVQKSDANNLSDDDVAAFKLGVEKSKESRILNGLFTVRTNQLFNKLDKKQNAFYLSGLLIGEEMNYLLNDEEKHIALCSASNLGEFYKMAIEALGLLRRTTIILAELVDNAALAGQVLIYNKQNLNGK